MNKFYIHFNTRNEFTDEKNITCGNENLLCKTHGNITSGWSRRQTRCGSLYFESLFRRLALLNRHPLYT